MKIITIIFVIIVIIIINIFTFALARAQSALHRMEERWERNGEPPFERNENAEEEK